jgi:hypothetical protein
MQRTPWLIIGTLLLAGGCHGQVVEVPGGEPAGPPTFEEFKANVPWSTASEAFIVEGDIPIRGEAALRTYYEARVGEHQRAEEGQPLGAAGEAHERVSAPLIVHQENGADSRWQGVAQTNITYCVSTSFGSRYAIMLMTLQQAAADWAAAANVRFVHLPEHDSNCTNANGAVVFNVRPVEGQSYHAAAFFPTDLRAQRQLLVNGSAFAVAPPRTFGGILRHELGHALGFRHEITRKVVRNDTRCFEDPLWRPLTVEEQLSVMYYDVCSGQKAEFALTENDRRGAACLYGPAPGNPAPSCGFRGIVYRSKVAGHGWLPEVWAGDLSGTVRQSRPMEATRISLAGVSGLHVCYQAHVGQLGWQPPVCNNTATIEGSDLQAISIVINNQPVFGASVCNVFYRAHVADVGWMPLVSNGTMTGTTGESRSIQALQILSDGSCGF